MCWQENVSVIAMLTQGVENGRLKCETYWPESVAEVTQTACCCLLLVECLRRVQFLEGAERLYGVINVRLVQCGGDEFIKQRRFVLTNVREQRSRELCHWQYVEW